MVSVLAALSPSCEHCSFVEIHRIDTDWFSQADSPAGHCGPLKAFSLPGEQSEDRWRGASVGWLPLPGPQACLLPPLATCPSPPPIYPWLEPGSWTGIRYPSLRNTPSPSGVWKCFPRPRAGVHYPSCQTAHTLPKWQCWTQARGHIPLGPLDF